jgi:maleylacetoacetate isomerase/maleylpyruvate isomerase
MAIIEYLDETHAETPLLPRCTGPCPCARIGADGGLRDPSAQQPARAQVPGAPNGASDEAKNGWYAHWVRSGLEAFERQLALLDAERKASGLAPSTFCWGDTPTLAECCLVPQIYNAQRFNVNLEALPRLMGVVERCNALPAFQQAHPSACPDAE